MFRHTRPAARRLASCRRNAVLLIAVLLILAALTFLPALALGPIVEHLLLHGGKLF